MVHPLECLTIALAFSISDAIMCTTGRRQRSENKPEHPDIGVPYHMAGNEPTYFYKMTPDEVKFALVDQTMPVYMLHYNKTKISRTVCADLSVGAEQGKSCKPEFVFLVDTIPVDKSKNGWKLEADYFENMGRNIPLLTNRKIERPVQMLPECVREKMMAYGHKLGIGTRLRNTFNKLFRKSKEAATTEPTEPET